MNSTLVRPPSLNPRETEREAIACFDTGGVMHWIRVFDVSASVVKRGGGIDAVRARRFEATDGSPAYHVDDVLYLIYRRQSQGWLEVETVAPTARLSVA